MLKQSIIALAAGTVLLAGSALAVPTAGAAGDASTGNPKTATSKRTHRHHKRHHTTQHTKQREQ